MNIREPPSYGDVSNQLAVDFWSLLKREWTDSGTFKPNSEITVAARPRTPAAAQPRKEVAVATAQAWEPGDDICPPWPWWWHGPRPNWLDDSVLESVARSW